MLLVLFVSFVSTNKTNKTNKVNIQKWHILLVLLEQTKLTVEKTKISLKAKKSQKDNKSQKA